VTRGFPTNWATLSCHYSSCGGGVFDPHSNPWGGEIPSLLSCSLPGPLKSRPLLTAGGRRMRLRKLTTTAPWSVPAAVLIQMLPLFDGPGLCRLGHGFLSPRPEQGVRQPQVRATCGFAPSFFLSPQTIGGHTFPKSLSGLAAGKRICLSQGPLRSFFFHQDYRLPVSEPAAPVLPPPECAPRFGHAFKASSSAWEFRCAEPTDFPFFRNGYGQYVAARGDSLLMVAYPCPF